MRPGIQIAWSPAPIDGAVITSLIQVYSVVLSALISIIRQKLSLFDANYALIVSSSPLTIWLVFTSICDLSGVETEFIERIQSHRAIIRIFGALFLPLWVGLNLAILLSSRGFIDGELCSNSTFKDQLLMDPILLIPIFCFSLLALSSVPLPGLPLLFPLVASPLLLVPLTYPHLPALYLALPLRGILVAAPLSIFWEVFVILIANPSWYFFVIVGVPSTESNTM